MSTSLHYNHLNLYHELIHSSYSPFYRQDNMVNWSIKKSAWSQWPWSKEYPCSCYPASCLIVVREGSSVCYLIWREWSDSFVVVEGKVSIESKSEGVAWSGCSLKKSSSNRKISDMIWGQAPEEAESGGFLRFCSSSATAWAHVCWTVKLVIVGGLHKP